MFSVRGRSAGFSLVEMVAALFIFSVSVLATLEVFAVCLRSTDMCLSRTRAAFLAQGLIEETVAEGILTSGEDSGEFGEGFSRATWTREITETDTTGLYELRVTVAWTDRGKERKFELTTLAAER